MYVAALGKGSEEVNIIGTGELNKEALAIEPNQVEREEMVCLEGENMDTMKKVSLNDMSKIDTFDIHEPEPVRPLIDLKSVPYDVGIVARMTTSSDPPPSP